MLLAISAALPAAFSADAAPSTSTSPQPLVLRAWGVPDDAGSDPGRLAQLEILAAFKRHFPNVTPISPTGLEIPGRSMDIVPLMQIAGDIPQEVMYVNLRQSATYIANRFLYPLDHYVEKTAGVEVKNSYLLPLDAYLTELQKGPNYKAELSERVTPQCWEVMRRHCPYGKDCPYVKEWGGAPIADHQHTWFFPQSPEVMALYYRKDLFYEAGLPNRAPTTLDEMFDWAKKTTNPKEDRYGLQLNLDEIGWSTLNILYSYGGRLVEQDEKGHWRCAFDSEEAVEAYYFVARLFHEPFDNKYGHFNGVVFLGDENASIRIAMRYNYLSSTAFAKLDPAANGFGPPPAGPSGKGAGEFNASMTGVYAGLENDPAKRDAAWEYIRFFNCPEAQQIRARVYVENGLGQFVHPSLLRASGYPEFVQQVPKGWEEEYHSIVMKGVPEPYGENTQQVYKYASKAIDQIRTDSTIIDAIERGDAATAKNAIREILKARVAYGNEKMLNILPPEIRAFRHHVALFVAIAILIVFALTFWNVISTFAQKGVTGASPGWKSKQHKWAYLCLFPAMLSIAMWEYYPLARGTVMAFQSYNVRGFSEWVGLENFASVLFDQEFWYAMWVSLEYAFLSMIFGFCAPIALAFLLSEVPKGKTLFRTIYYLPAVLSGVVVLFLWKNFYSAEGTLNQIVNVFVHIINVIPFIHLNEHHSPWLTSPSAALFCCLLPTIWAGMGPGCLIYLAALKTIPEEIYEAADIDGAGVMKKIFYVALPSIKALITINFIGALIGVMKSGGQNILVMTGGGPYTPNGQTEVVGLHIYWESFAYLRFGPATAMAWILGSMLIGFTVIQLKRLKNMEFKSAETV